MSIQFNVNNTGLVRGVDLTLTSADTLEVPFECSGKGFVTNDVMMRVLRACETLPNPPHGGKQRTALR